MSTDTDSAFTSRPHPPGYVYARAWIRFFAFMIDGFVAIVPLFLLMLLAAVVLGHGPGYIDYLLDPGQSGWVTALVMQVASSLVVIGWLAGWQTTAGASPGMMLLRLRVRGPNGQDNPSLPAAMIRNAVPILANLSSITENYDINMALGLIGLVVYLAIGITISNSPTCQGFHDRLAGGTYVLRRARKGTVGSEST
jgi:uncharacterized RDD family membrane protein YckC